MNTRYLLQHQGVDGRIHENDLKETGHEGSSGSGVKQDALYLTVISFLPQRPGFNARSGHVGFVVNKMAGFLKSTSISPTNSHSTSCSASSQHVTLLLSILSVSLNNQLR
jgi:hypothetical protein